MNLSRTIIVHSIPVLFSFGGRDLHIIHYSFVHPPHLFVPHNLSNNRVLILSPAFPPQTTSSSSSSSFTLFHPFVPFGDRKIFHSLKVCPNPRIRHRFPWNRFTATCPILTDPNTRQISILIYQTQTPKRIEERIEVFEINNLDKSVAEPSYNSSNRGAFFFSFSISEPFHLEIRRNQRESG